MQTDTRHHRWRQLLRKKVKGVHVKVKVVGIDHHLEIIMKINVLWREQRRRPQEIDGGV